MKILKVTMIIITLSVLAAIGFLAYMGVFSPIKVYEAKMGPYTIAYEEFVGPYAQTGPVFARVYKSLKDEGIQSSMGLGIYYDDPSKVAADKLRSDCGVVIEERDLDRFYQVETKFKVKRIEQGDCVVVEFPLRNTLSYMIGPIKAYPALTKHVAEKNLGITMSYELYDEAKGKIFFVLAIAK